MSLQDIQILVNILVGLTVAVKNISHVLDKRRKPDKEEQLGQGFRPLRRKPLLFSLQTPASSFKHS